MKKNMAVSPHRHGAWGFVFLILVVGGFVLSILTILGVRAVRTIVFSPPMVASRVTTPAVATMTAVVAAPKAGRPNDPFVGVPLVPQDPLGETHSFVHITIGAGGPSQASFSYSVLTVEGTVTLENRGWGKHMQWIDPSKPGEFTAASGVKVKVVVVSTTPPVMEFVSSENTRYKVQEGADLSGVAVFLGYQNDDNKLVFWIKQIQ